VLEVFILCWHCFQVLEQALKGMFITENNLQAMWKNKDQEVSDLEKDLQQQTSKLQRAEKQLHKALREVRGMSQTKSLSLELVSESSFLHFKIPCL
jgi:uncharacterized protein (DUF3084 family)